MAGAPQSSALYSKCFLIFVHCVYSYFCVIFFANTESNRVCVAVVFDLSHGPVQKYDRGDCLVDQIEKVNFVIVNKDLPAKEIFIYSS